MPQLSPLDILYVRRQILAGDYLAGKEFAFLARRGGKEREAALAAAQAALDKAGGDARHMIEAVVLDGQLPRSERGLSATLNGLDALNRHFRAAGRIGQPTRDILTPGCRPVRATKRVGAA